MQSLKDGSISIEKAKAMVDVSGAIAKNTSLQLQAFKLTKGQTPAPKTITSKKIMAYKDSTDVYLSLIHI